MPGCMSQATNGKRRVEECPASALGSIEGLFFASAQKKPRPRWSRARLNRQLSPEFRCL